MTNKIISPKDFFLYISATLFLFLSAISFLQFIFAVTNIAFPETFDYYQGNYELLRFALSLLVVSFPLFVFFTRKVNAYLHKNKDERENSIRKWLTYLTLFVTTITSVVTIVVLLNVFLEGSLTARFVIKVASVLIVTAAVFAFYKRDLKGDWYKKPAYSKKIGYVASFVVLVSIFIGFTVVGSPAEQRRIRNDQNRINDLRSIQYQVLDYWRRAETLPETLSVLNDPLQYSIDYRDPVTNDVYSYNTKDALTFEVCAVFEAQSLEFEEGLREPSRAYGKGFLEEDQNWQHGAGLHCFERTINPDLHKQI